MLKYLKTGCSLLLVFLVCLLSLTLLYQLWFHHLAGGWQALPGQAGTHGHWGNGTQIMKYLHHYTTLGIQQEIRYNHQLKKMLQN